MLQYIKYLLTLQNDIVIFKTMLSRSSCVCVFVSMFHNLQSTSWIIIDFTLFCCWFCILLFSSFVHCPLRFNAHSFYFKSSGFCVKFYCGWSCTVIAYIFASREFNFIFITEKKILWKIKIEEKSTFSTEY